MCLRLLEFLRFPECQAKLACNMLETQRQTEGGEVVTGLLHCVTGEHWFPIVRGIPRMLPDAIRMKCLFGIKLLDLVRSGPATTTDGDLVFVGVTVVQQSRRNLIPFCNDLPKLRRKRRMLK